MEDWIPINDLITLSPLTPEDKPNMIRYLNDAAVGANTLAIPQPYTEADADERLEKVQQLREEHGQATQWIIRHRDAGAIGGIGAFLKTGLQGHSDEIGYWLAEPFRGQGIMTEVVRRLTDLMFEQRPLVRIEAYVFAHNPASIRLLEKAGFEREGYLRKLHRKNGAYVDVVVMARVRAPD